MKNFYASLAVFSLLITLTVCNYFYINRVADTLFTKTQALPPCEDATAAVDALCNYWEGQEQLVGLSVSYQYTAKMGEYLLELKSAAAQREQAEFTQGRARLYSAIEDIRRLERFSIDSLL